MNSLPDLLPAGEPDPLSASTAGAAISAVASVVWPVLAAATLSLAVLASFVVWIRALRAWRRSRRTPTDTGGLLSLALVGGTGWGAALLLGPVVPLARPLLLGALAVGLWVTARHTLAGG
jgi:hypothetical protein